MGKVLQGLSRGEIVNGMKIVREESKTHKNVYAYKIVRAK